MQEVDWYGCESLDNHLECSRIHYGIYCSETMTYTCYIIQRERLIVYDARFTYFWRNVIHVTLFFRFRENMKKFTLISPRSYGSGLPLAGVSSKQGMTLSPPQSLMDFSPLSQLTNRVIAGLNELRQCAAIGVSPSVHRQLVIVMESVIHELCEYHRCVSHVYCLSCSLSICLSVCVYICVCVCLFIYVYL